MASENRAHSIRNGVITLLGICFIIYLTIILVSYTTADPSWFHASTSEKIVNIGGLLGSWIASFIFTFLGKSSWLILVFIAYELLLLWWKRKVIITPIRWSAYVFVLFSVSAILTMVSTVGHHSIMEATSELPISPLLAEEMLTYGGIVGYELAVRINLLFIKPIFTWIFLVIFLCILATLAFDIRWKSTFSHLFSLDWLGNGVSGNNESSQNNTDTDEMKINDSNRIESISSIDDNDIEELIVDLSTGETFSKQEHLIKHQNLENESEQMSEQEQTSKQNIDQKSNQEERDNTQDSQQPTVATNNENTDTVFTNIKKKFNKSLEKIQSLVDDTEKKPTKPTPEEKASNNFNQIFVDSDTRAKNQVIHNETTNNTSSDAFDSESQQPLPEGKHYGLNFDYYEDNEIQQSSSSLKKSSLDVVAKDKGAEEITSAWLSLDGMDKTEDANNDNISSQHINQPKNNEKESTQIAKSLLMDYSELDQGQEEYNITEELSQKGATQAPHEITYKSNDDSDKKTINKQQPEQPQTIKSKRLQERQKPPLETEEKLNNDDKVVDESSPNLIQSNTKEAKVERKIKSKYKHTKSDINESEVDNYLKERNVNDVNDIKSENQEQLVVKTKPTVMSKSTVASKSTVSESAAIEKPSLPDIHDDQAFIGKSRAFQTAKYRKSLTEIPSLDLLDKPDLDKKPSYTLEELDQLSELLEIKLQDFNIKAQVVSSVPGPVVTRFEVELAPGIKVAKVVNISRDLARSLSMASLRVVEIIPGKPYIGIEVPNSKREMVRLIELLDTDKYLDPNAQISMAMGKDIGGKPIITDLAKAPHMLVAGTTGSGKSVLVNSMLLSILLKYKPDELRLILIDPKQLELANYNDIPHLLTPVVTDMTEAAGALSWCVGEMERRYQLMSLLRVRKLKEFNKKVIEAKELGHPIIDPLWRPNDSASVDKAPKLKPLPMIVIVADEFADMIMQVGKQAEELITRLAQKSRASGIHLMLATQRPSVDVITGLIKANVPVRSALRVNSKVDSRTILDTGGAEDMLGNGDMLFLGPGQIEAERVHGAFVSDEEVNRVCEAWRERGAPEYIDNFSDDFQLSSPDSGSSGITGTSGEDDSFYSDAVAFVLETRKASASSIQRKFSIGYNRAARIIDSMEQAGIVSPMIKGKREILV